MSSPIAMTSAASMSNSLASRETPAHLFTCGSKHLQQLDAVGRQVDLVRDDAVAVRRGQAPPRPRHRSGGTGRACRHASCAWSMRRSARFVDRRVFMSLRCVPVGPPAVRAWAQDVVDARGFTILQDERREVVCLEEPRQMSAASRIHAGGEWTTSLPPTSDRHRTADEDAVATMVDGFERARALVPRPAGRDDDHVARLCTRRWLASCVR